MKSHGLRALTVATLLTACSDGMSPGEPGELITELPRALSAAEVSLISASNAFGTELFRRVVSGDDRDNVIISPLSASMALGMTLNGAASTTFDGMADALGFGGMTQEEINVSYRGLIDLLTELDPTVTFEIANAVWTREGFPFRDSFAQAVSAAFDARVEARDFEDPATLAAINDWVDDRTHGLIDSIVDSLDPALVMLLVNAIYYEAEWRKRFEPSDTRPAPFTRDDGTTVTVDMMRVDGGGDRMGWGPDYVAVELPYGGGAFTMLVIVPTGPTTARELVDALDGPGWNALVDGLGQGSFAYVELPKFTLTYDGYLNAALRDMGMDEAFTPSADFTNMSPLGDALCISYVRQKTYVEVDERGTRAAAVTAVGTVITSAPPAFTADRPFVFAIRERISGTLLFTGVVGDPTADPSEPQGASSDCG